MTEADKIEIDNLVKGLKDMKSYADKTGGYTMNDAIVNFATEARNDYAANKLALRNIVQDNLGLFLNLDALQVSDGGCSLEGVRAARLEPFVMKLGNDIHAVLQFFDESDRIITENTGYHHTFKVKQVNVNEVYWYTSDTDSADYHVCCWENLVERGGINTPIDRARDAKGWQWLYTTACRTREMNVRLIAKFKALLANRTAAFRAKANADELTAGNLKATVGVYVKVDL